MKFALHKIAGGGLPVLVKGLILPFSVKQPKVRPAFKPMHIDQFRFQKPHFVWYLRRNEKRIIEFSVGFGLALTVLFLIIKNV